MKINSMVLEILRRFLQFIKTTAEELLIKKITIRFSVS